MKKLFRKLRARSGLSMVEMLAAVAALTLLCLALNSGMNIAVHAYRSMIAESETELLLSTAADALTDELRYASDIVVTGDILDQYTSAHFAHYSSIEINDKDQLVVKNATGSHPLIATGAYGKNGVYKLSFRDASGDPGGSIEYNDTTHIFTFTLRAEQEGLALAQQTFTVRCLNGGVT